MFLKYSLVAILFAYLQSVHANVPFITKCTAKDTDCLKSSANAAIPIFAAGLPELGVEVMDPITFKKINSSSNSLTLIFSDVTIKGLKSCQFKKLSRDATNKKLKGKIYCDIVVDGQYVMDGLVNSFLPIKGNGKAHTEHKKLAIDLLIDYAEKNGADGKNHWEITDWKHTYEYRGKSVLRFDNLFDGNELLGRVARELMDSRPNELATETAGPMIKDITASIVKNINAFFQHVPVEDLALD